MPTNEFGTSKAFAGFGTRTYVDGQRLTEVSFISIGRRVFMRANHIPSDPAQQKLIVASLDRLPVTIEVFLPRDLGEFRFRSVIIDAKVKLMHDKVARLILSFETPGDMQMKIGEDIVIPA